MKPSSLSRGRLLTLALSALTLLLAFSACTTGGTPTATSTPSPTPTPTPPPDAIASIKADATFGDLAALLPDSVTSCLRSDLGARYETLLARRIFDVTLNVSTDDLPLHCFDQESLVDLFMASLSAVADGLSTPTLTCLRETFSGLNVETLTGLTTGNLGESMDDAMSVGVGMLVCLTDEEAESITAGSLFGDAFGGADLSLKDVRCVFQSVDLTQLIRWIEGMSSGEGTATPDFSQMLELLEAVQNCDIDLNSLMGEGDMAATDEGDVEPMPTIALTFDLSQIDQLPPELQASVRCLIDAVGGEENAQGFIDGTYTPELSQLMAALQCNVDPSMLNEFATAQ